MIDPSGFSTPGLHHLVYRDDFCAFAGEIRDELLRFSRWIPMTQGEGYDGGRFVPHRQSGLTTGHLDDVEFVGLSWCRRFRDFLDAETADLCHLVGVVPLARMEVEINAMAYGEGGRLAWHTDHGGFGVDERPVAWMLYLTEPADGEWSPEQGGAVRLRGREGVEAHLAPRFNRFALFRVGPESHHEIGTVTWKCGWRRCRLALSGWIRGPQVDATPGRHMRVYLRSEDYRARRARLETVIGGALAVYRLMCEQRAHAAIEGAEPASRVAALERDCLAHRSSPEGTSFLRYAPGPAWCVTVVDEAQNVVYVGAADGYGTR